MSSCAVIIPARFASTRFPGKPLHVIAGKPLVQHVWERCRGCRNVSRVVVATDDDRIAETARGFGAEVCMTSRPPEPLNESLKFSISGAVRPVGFTLREGRNPPSASRRDFMYFTSGLSGPG